MWSGEDTTAAMEFEEISMSFGDSMVHAANASDRVLTTYK